MVSTTESRPTHYEILGLEPTASSAEIDRAFSSRAGVFQPRAIGHIAEASIAFATLRDPIKRRAYDASLGVKPEPAPSASLMMWGGKSQFIAPAVGGLAGRDYNDRSPTLAPPAEPPPRPLAVPEPRTGAAIAASLRAAAPPEAQLETRPVSRLEQSLPPRSRPADVASRIEPKIGRDDVPGRADALRPGAAEDHPVEWKRAAIVAGAMIGAVALVGAWLGVEAGNDTEQAPPKPAVTVALAPAQTPPAAAAPAPVTARDFEEAREQPGRPAVAVVQNARPAPPPRPAATTETAQSEQAQSTADPAEQAVAQSSPATPVAASLPLSNATIASTIQRIGYACGRVASTTAEAGAAGVFRVNCTSGNSYQATPVRGRYRFRRLGGN